MKKLLSLLLCLLLTGCAVTYDGPTQTVLVLDYTDTEHYWDDGSLMYQERTEYAYDIYGNVAQTIRYQDGEKTAKTVNRYDENGNLLRYDDYSLTGWLPDRTQRTEYTYDAQGRMLSDHTETSGGSWGCTIEYDDEANTQTLRYGEDFYTIQYFNEQGYMMRSETHQKDGTLDITEYTRRPDGLPLRWDSWTGGVQSHSIVYEYDDQGRRTLQQHYEGDTLDTDFRWEYDDENLTVTQYQSNGNYIVTGYYEEGRIRVRESWTAEGILNSRTLYRYREIRVPAKEETP